METWNQIEVVPGCSLTGTLASHHIPGRFGVCRKAKPRGGKQHLYETNLMVYDNVFILTIRYLKESVRNSKCATIFPENKDHHVWTESTEKVWHSITRTATYQTTDLKICSEISPQHVITGCFFRDSKITQKKINHIVFHDPLAQVKEPCSRWWYLPENAWFKFKTITSSGPHGFLY